MSSFTKSLFRLTVVTFIFAMLMPVTTTRAGPPDVNGCHPHKEDCGDDPDVEVSKYTVDLFGDLISVGDHDGSGLGERFRWISDLRDEELPAIYRRATASVAPSLYEGFGMTPLESMACGVPVVSCDNPAYREVAGDAAIYFEGATVKELEERLLEISRSEALRKSLVESGFRRAERMTWRKTAEETWEVYRRLLWP